MIAILRRALEELPITAGCLFFAGLLFMGVAVHEFQMGIQHHVALSAWGASSQFALWDGDWWRVIISAFHHVNLLHLFMNAMAMWYLGGILESRLGPQRYGLFLAASIVVCGLVSGLVENSVGLSGVVYALFGLLLVWRQIDPVIEAQIPNSTVGLGLAWLFLCVPLDYFNIIRIGNGAHFSGFIYGWIAGQVWLANDRSKVLQAVFLSLHLLLLPGFYFLTHPIWNGTYHWRMAEKTIDDAERVRHWKAAVAADPRLAGPWYNIALINRQQGDFLEAWRVMLTGISHNPAYQDGIQLARLIWQELPNAQERAQAARILKDVFKQDAPEWEKSLISDDPIAQLPVERPPTLAPRGVIPMPIEPFLAPPSRAGKLPPPNPDAPHSAEEGRAV